jgi:hypothetical protein
MSNRSAAATLRHGLVIRRGRAVGRHCKPAHIPLDTVALAFFVTGRSREDLDMLMRVVFSGRVIAEDDDTLVVEGSQYSPANSLHRTCRAPAATQSACPWKGAASTFNVRAVGAAGPIDVGVAR